ncbi:22947_t:CDS:2, partial [Dentiscutata erythropus]
MLIKAQSFSTKSKAGYKITQHQTKIYYITKHTSIAVPQVWSRITSSEDFCWATPPQKSMKYRSSPPSSPVLEPKEDLQHKEIALIGKDLDNIDVKEKFLVGLSPDNEKHVE